MKKIIVTLILTGLIGFSVNAQVKKTSQTAISQMTAVQKVSAIKSTLGSTTLTKAQISNCLELVNWSFRKKDAIKNDNTLSATDKQSQNDLIDGNVNTRLTDMIGAANLKLITPYIK